MSACTHHQSPSRVPPADATTCALTPPTSAARTVECEHDAGDEVAEREEPPHRRDGREHGRVVGEQSRDEA
jgi:hypothetical protein